MLNSATDLPAQSVEQSQVGSSPTIGARNSRSHWRHLLWIALVGTVVWSGLMYWEVSGFKTDCPTHYGLKTIVSNGGCSVTNPLAELELSRDPAAFRTIISQTEAPKSAQVPYSRWNIEVIRVNTFMDFLFIALYWSTFVLLGSLCQSWLSRIVIATISITALFDVAENVRLFQALHALRLNQTPTQLPGTVSAVKWAFLGVSAVSLAIALLKEKRPSQIAIAVFLMASGVVTWIGIAHVPLLEISMLLLGLALLIAILRFFPIQPFNWTKLLEWVEYFYLIRFQVLAALLLAIAIPTGYFAAPSIFVGLFDARGLISFTLIVWMAVHLAFTVMIASRLILVYGPERFDGIRNLKSSNQGNARKQNGDFQPRSGDATYSEMGIFGLLAAPSVVMLCCGTDLAWYEKLIGTAIGFALGIGFWILTAALHYAIERCDAAGTAARVFPSFGFLRWRESSSRSWLWRFVDRNLQGLPDRLTAGLVSEGRLRSGHEVATIALLIQLIIYVVLGFALRPDRALPEHQPATLYFAFFLIMLATWFFSGAAFFLDAVRLPVLSTLLILSILSGTIARTDHEFTVSATRPHYLDVSPINVVRQWAIARQKASNAPVIVVATAGGGIRAAAWTAQVLTGLEEASQTNQCSSTLSTSILAISSVSGGSVGNMFFIAGYDSKTGDFGSGADTAKSVRFNASRSALSSVGWGLLYPDAARTVPLLGMLIPQDIDRGWALENAWISGWRNPPNISDWRADVAAGRRPAAIFNATAAENGDRFLIASTDLNATVIHDLGGKLEDRMTIQFSDKFRRYDVPVATAARLSATFPYVSPEARASDGPEEARVHIGDGGYYDNSGVLSSLEWLEEASAALHGHPVLVLLIDAETGAPPAVKRWSWQMQLVSPINTLLNVRTASQELRSSIELGIGARLLHSQPGLEVATVSFLFGTPLPAPLSWHLTPDQHQNIVENWQASSESTKTVLRFLGCRIENN